MSENGPVYEVYWRVFNVLENIDPFKIMGAVGIRTEDHIYCLDLIQAARNKVLEIKRLKNGRYNLHKGRYR
jgi:hypothetical protein